MLSSLLVPLDGSNLSEGSLSPATTVAQASGARLNLVHVHVPYEPDQLLGNTSFQLEGVDIAEYDARHREEAERYLAEVEARVGQQGLKVTSRVLDGPPVVEELSRYADEVDTDMVFMTSHGYSGFRRAWLGSVTDEMMRRSTSPIFVLRPGDNGTLASSAPIGHILVPLDGSELAESAFGPTSALVEATGARVTLVHVVALEMIFGPRIRAYLGLESQIKDALVHLDRTADVLRERGFDVAIHATHGESPAPTIAELATRLDADLIAIATHGYGGVKRVVLGSVADKLLRVSPLPLLVTRPPAAK